jgi:hypothetical protein
MVRLTTWNLEGETSKAQEPELWARAATTLHQLKPDIIVLQGVRDWPMCARLAQALKPAQYHVLLCSAFAAEPGAESQPHQVAVLSRWSGYFSWSEAWQDQPGARNGGFGFVALHSGKYRLGILSVECGGVVASETAVGQVLRQIESVRHWRANRVQTFIIAGTLHSAAAAPTAAPKSVLGSLEKAGFTDARLLLAPVQDPGAAQKPNEFLLLDPGSFPSNPDPEPVAKYKDQPLTCDLELDPASAAAAWKQWVQEKQAEALAELARETAAMQARAHTQAGAASPTGLAQGGLPFAVSWWLAATLGGVLTLLPFVWLLARRRARPPGSPALLPEQAGATLALPSSYTVVLSPPLPAGADSAAEPGSPRPVLQVENPGATRTQSTLWQQRALNAEQQAARAQALLRGKLLPDLRRWLKQKLVRKLATDRSSLLEAQQAAARKAAVTDQRLARIESQISQQNRAYEQRIAELTCELLSAKEENRELIRARIAEVKAEMAAAQARLRAQAD